MYLIKQLPEDFIVEEIPKIKLGNGPYTYFILEKRLWNTNDAIKAIASRVNVKEKYFNVAGIKDKQAVTKQYVSVLNVSRQRLESLKIKDIKIKVVGNGTERLKLGQLKANHFKVIVRNLEKEYDKISFIENYYDDQRFGGRNAILGKALVKGKYRKACYTLRLRWDKSDYLGSLRKLGKKLLRLYVNAYQSLLFNQALAAYLKSKYKKYYTVDYSKGEFVFSNEKLKNGTFPILGFLTDFKNKEIANIYEDLMKKEKLRKEDFIMKSTPELSSEGNERKMFVTVDDLKLLYSKDELHKGKLKAVLDFKLPPGSYATLVIKKMFNK
ncbi:MAG: tRNA pseudouridine(13) synthase TruD [archaeon]